MYLEYPGIMPSQVSSEYQIPGSAEAVYYDDSGISFYRTVDTLRSAYHRFQLSDGGSFVGKLDRVTRGGKDRTVQVHFSVPDSGVEQITLEGTLALLINTFPAIRLSDVQKMDYA